MNRLAFVGVLLLSLSIAAHPATQAASEDVDQVSTLLSTAKDQARALTADVSAYGFFAGSDGGWQSHSVIGNIYKGHIEALRKQIAALNKAREGAAPWQQATIDRICPLLTELAETADRVIAAFDKTPAVADPEKRKEFLKLSSDLAGELSRLVGSFLDYGKTRQEFASFETGLPASSAGLNSAH